jgi:hypothetical protein
MSESFEFILSFGVHFDTIIGIKVDKNSKENIFLTAYLDYSYFHSKMFSYKLNYPYNYEIDKNDEQL